MIENNPYEKIKITIEYTVNQRYSVVIFLFLSLTIN